MLTQTSNLREGTYKKSSLALKHSWLAVKWSREEITTQTTNPSPDRERQWHYGPWSSPLLPSQWPHGGDVWAYFLGEPPSSRMMQQDREREREESYIRASPWHQLDKQSMLQRPLYNLQRYSVSGPRMIGGPVMSKRVPSRETSTCSPGLHIYYGKNPEIYEVLFTSI